MANVWTPEFVNLITEQLAQGKSKKQMARELGCTPENIRAGLKRHASGVPHRKNAGMHSSPIYRLWWGMISRCTHPKTRGYANYGGAGVAVCERWLSFENFYADMGDRPEGMTLDRIDSSKNYEPGNVRWATNYDQQRNKRNNILVRWEGKQFVLADICKILGIHASNVHRLRAQGVDTVVAIQKLLLNKERRNGKVLAA